MAASFQKISEDKAIEEIVSVVQKSKQGEAPFVVIVGAGFSHPLVETTHGFVHKNLPALDNSFVSEPFKPQPNSRHNFADIIQPEQRHQKEQLERRTISFWKRFNKENESVINKENKPCKIHVELNSRGLPLQDEDAYQKAFDDDAVWPFSNRTERDKFLYKFTKPDQPQLNAAHSIGILPWRAPGGLRSEALLRRGFVHYQKYDFPKFLSDTESAVKLQSPTYIKYIFPEFTQDAEYNLGLALLANNRDEEAIAAYRKAVKTAKMNSKFFNKLALEDLKEAVGRWLTTERAKPCIAILESFEENS